MLLGNISNQAGSKSFLRFCITEGMVVTPCPDFRFRLLGVKHLSGWWWLEFESKTTLILAYTPLEEDLVVNRQD